MKVHSNYEPSSGGHLDDDMTGPDMKTSSGNDEVEIKQKRDNNDLFQRIKILQGGDSNDSAFN